MNSLGWAVCCWVLVNQWGNGSTGSTVKYSMQQIQEFNKLREYTYSIIPDLDHSNIYKNNLINVRCKEATWLLPIDFPYNPLKDSRSCEPRRFSSYLFPSSAASSKLKGLAAALRSHCLGLDLFNGLQYITYLFVVGNEGMIHNNHQWSSQQPPATHPFPTKHQ